MHSPYETAGAKDTEYLVKLTKTFYETVIENQSGLAYTVK